MIARAIAFYLPQFHPIPENDCWWGKGFTEWTNVTKTRPLFAAHHQPKLPADLGFYDLRVPEVREAQACLAREHGIEAFCYWHYWFAGERLLERPFQEVLDSGKPEFPFCLAWANHDWNGLWFGGEEKRTLKKQTYPGRDDHKQHFDFLLTAFRDPRYLRVDGKPLLLIYDPPGLPDCREVLRYWRELARKAGLPDLYLIANLGYDHRHWDARTNGFDAITVWTMGKMLAERRSCLWTSRLKAFLKHRKPRRLYGYCEKYFPGLERVFDYEEARPSLICSDKFLLPHHPIAVPNWDTTARYGRNAIIMHNSTPDKFRLHLKDVLHRVEETDAEHRIVFIKSWNEWAEGNYVEPDQRFGHGYLKVVKDELSAIAE
jgi:lipopolysaccharide biosynthesis protein